MFDINTWDDNLRKLEQELRVLSTESNWLTIDQQDSEDFSDLIVLLSQEEFEQAEKLNSVDEDYPAANLSQPIGNRTAVLKQAQFRTENNLYPSVDRNKPSAGGQNSPSQVESNSADSFEDKESSGNILKLEDAQSLDSLRVRMRGCARCGLSMGRKTIVFGQGNPNADIMFIGEGPGADEDDSGIVFIGKAGKLLTQLIQSIGLNRKSVYITNVVKCRPPGNRNPKLEEIQACNEILRKEIELVQPKLIVTLGLVATKTLLHNQQNSTMSSLRGRIFDYRGIELLPTFHPSYLLRSPGQLGKLWVDMRKIRQIIFKQKSRSLNNKT